MKAHYSNCIGFDLFYTINPESLLVNVWSQQELSIDEGIDGNGWKKS
jgi:hypothetical protein